MLNTQRLILTAALLAACGPEFKDDDDGEGSSEPTGCALDITYSYPDGSDATLTDCAGFILDTTFEFDPDERPLVRSYGLTLFNTTDTDFECWLDMTQYGVCGTGYYRQGEGTAGEVRFATLDCAGAPNEYESTYRASNGYVRITSIATSKDGSTGNFSGEPIMVEIAGDIAIVAQELTVSGSFLVREEIIGIDTEESDCQVHDSPS